MSTHNVCFVDTETTGLDPDRHEIWEVALISPEPDGSWTEHVWQLPVDLSRADPMSLAMNGFHDRRWRATPSANHPQEALSRPYAFAHEFVRLTRGLHLVGAVISFDADRLWRLLRANKECPLWHYHVIDCEALAAGYILGRVRGIAAAGDVTRFGGAVDAMPKAIPPWNSTELSLSVGVDPDKFDRHTALGDARWAKAMYEAVTTYRGPGSSDPVGPVE